MDMFDQFAQFTDHRVEVVRQYANFVFAFHVYCTGQIAARYRADRRAQLEQGPGDAPRHEHRGYKCQDQRQQCSHTHRQAHFVAGGMGIGQGFPGKQSADGFSFRSDNRFIRSQIGHAEDCGLAVKTFSLVQN